VIISLFSYDVEIEEKKRRKMMLITIGASLRVLKGFTKQCERI